MFRIKNVWNGPSYFADRFWRHSYGEREKQLQIFV